MYELICLLSEDWSGYTESLRDSGPPQEKESAMTRKKSPTLLPDASCLQLVRLQADKQFLLAIVATTSSGALCPLCQSHSERIHSRYVRVVADLPWAGWVMRLELHVRRFSVKMKNASARSSLSACLEWWLPMPDEPHAWPICSHSSALLWEEKPEVAWWNGWG